MCDPDVGRLPHPHGWVSFGPMPCLTQNSAPWPAFTRNPIIPNQTKYILMFKVVLKINGVGEKGLIVWHQHLSLKQNTTMFNMYFLHSVASPYWAYSSGAAVHRILPTHARTRASTHMHTHARAHVCTHPRTCTRSLSNSAMPIPRPLHPLPNPYLLPTHPS